MNGTSAWVRCVYLFVLTNALHNDVRPYMFDASSFTTVSPAEEEFTAYRSSSSKYFLEFCAHRREQTSNIRHFRSDRFRPGPEQIVAQRSGVQIQHAVTDAQLSQHYTQGETFHLRQYPSTPHTRTVLRLAAICNTGNLKAALDFLQAMQRARFSWRKILFFGISGLPRLGWI